MLIIFGNVIPATDASLPIKAGWFALNTTNDRHKIMKHVQITGSILNFKQKYGFVYAKPFWRTQNWNMHLTRKGRLFFDKLHYQHFALLVECIRLNQHNKWVANEMPYQVRFLDGWADFAEKHDGDRKKILVPKTQTYLSLMVDEANNNIVVEPFPDQRDRDASYLFSITMTELYTIEQMIVDGDIELVEDSQE